MPEKALSIAISIEAAIKPSLLINNHQQLSKKSNKLQESVLKLIQNRNLENCVIIAIEIINLNLVCSKKKNAFIVKPKDMQQNFAKKSKNQLKTIQPTS